MFVFALVFFTALLYYINFRRTRKSLYELSESLPDIGGLPVVGHTHWFIGGPEKLLSNIKHLAEMVDQSSGGITKVWIGPSLYIVSLNPADVQKILDNCLKKDYSYKFLRNWLGNGLFVAPEQRKGQVIRFEIRLQNVLVDIWKEHRRLLVPIFHNKLVEDYIEVFGQQGSILEKILEEKCGKGEFDAFTYITSCMLDIVFETAMGERMEVQHNPNTPYLRARHTVMSIISMRLFKAWLQPDALFNLTPYSKMQKDNIDLTHKFTDEVVNKKRTLFEKNKNSHDGRKDMLELLLERNSKFTNTELREHIDSITIAGNDTTALVIAYTLLLLGCHEEEQEKVYQELQDIFGDSKRIPTKEDMNKMEYMERVIKESMRLYTVVPIIARETDKELKLSSCTLPAGVGCAVLPFVMHRSKCLWGSDADLFKPDRFLPENSVNRHPCAYIPFSHGVRNCIGRHFGMIAMKSILATLLRSYRIKSTSIDRLKIEILLLPVNGHLISIEKRQTN